jgi:hypothetical protein
MSEVLFFAVKTIDLPKRNPQTLLHRTGVVRWRRFKQSA